MASPAFFLFPSSHVAVVMHMVAKFCANDRDRVKPMHMVAKFCENDRYPCRALDMCFGMV